MKVKIVKIHENDAYYEDRKALNNLVGEWEYVHESPEDGFVGGEFLASKKVNIKGQGKSNRFYFYAIKVKYKGLILWRYKNV